MSDSRLGARLRDQLLRLGEDPGTLDSRRLQGLVGDLCGAEQRELLPALRYLVVSPPFLSALRSATPLQDPQLGDRLRHELRQVFAPALCARMEPVLQGLLGGADGSRAVARAAAAPAPIAAAEPAARPAIPPPEAVNQGSGGGSPLWLVAMLAFLSGGLLVALLAVLGGGEQVHVNPPSSREADSSDRPLPPEAPTIRPQAMESSSPATIIPALPPPPQVAPSSLPGTPVEEPAAEAKQGATATAAATVEALYASLSAGDSAGALQRLGGQAADQFDASFFRQFQEVRVADLQMTGSEGNTVMLEGVVTFLYPDGSRQRELRSFTVDTSQTPARITASAFGRVLSPRR